MSEDVRGLVAASVCVCVYVCVTGGERWQEGGDSGDMKDKRKLSSS